MLALRRLSFILISTACLGSFVTMAQAQDGFTPAVFGGLTIGKSTLAAAKQRFGKPRGSSQDKSGTWLYYENAGPVPGRVEIAAAPGSQKISFVTIYPTNLSLNDAKKLFGLDFKVIRYDFDVCLGDGDAGPIYESPNGSLEFVVYARLGIALLCSGDPVTQIQYRHGPLGAKQSRCKGKRPR